MTIHSGPAATTDLFWGFVQAGDGCWEWIGSRDRKGYGRLKKARLLAHRVSWERSVGPIPDGLCVLHRCDNPPCVRPEHLFLGTIKDNNNDMATKGRHGRYKSRLTHCPQGHRYIESNLVQRKHGWRSCLICHRKQQRDRYWRAKARAS